MSTMSIINDGALLNDQHSAGFAKTYLGHKFKTVFLDVTRILIERYL